jgi:hypothetical protein
MKFFSEELLSLFLSSPNFSCDIYILPYCCGCVAWGADPLVLPIYLFILAFFALADTAFGVGAAVCPMKFNQLPSVRCGLFAGFGFGITHAAVSSPRSTACFFQFVFLSTFIHRLVLQSATMKQ